MNLPDGSADLRAVVRWPVMVRVCAAWITAGLLLHAAGPLLLSPALPLVDSVVHVLQPQAGGTSKIVDSPDGWRLQSELFAVDPIRFPDGTQFRPGATIGRYSLSLSHALLPLLVFLASLAAWPAATAREALVRGVLALPCALLLFLVCTPVQLAGHMEIAIIRKLGVAGDPMYRHPIAATMVAMESGARLLIALVTAMVVIRVARRGDRRPIPAPDRVRGSTDARTAEPVAFPPVVIHLSPGNEVTELRPREPPAE